MNPIKRYINETKKISQEKFAHRAGVSQPWLNRFLNGRENNLSIATIVKLADAAGIAPDELFNYLVDVIALEVLKVS